MLQSRRTCTSACAIVITLCSSTGAPAALYAYVTQQTTNYTFTNASPGILTVSSSTRAEQNVDPADLESHTDELDPLQSYVGPAPGRPAENFFGRKGMTTPNYSRGDAVFAPSPIAPRHVAELFVSAPGSATAGSDSLVTIPLTVLGNGPVTITMNYSNRMVVDHPGTISGTVQATHAFELSIERSGMPVFFGAPNVLNRTTIYDSFNSSDEVLSGQVNFITPALDPGTYTAMIAIDELVTATILPEPGLGTVLLACLALSRRRRSSD